MAIRATCPEEKIQIATMMIIAHDEAVSRIVARGKGLGELNKSASRLFRALVGRKPNEIELKSITRN